MVSVRNQREEFVPGFLAIAESAQHGAGYGSRMLFLDATHHHAEMARLANHAYAPRFHHLLQGFSDFLRQALLNLEPPGEHVHDTWNFAQPNNLVLGQISHVHGPEERKQVMLAHAVELNVSHHDHFIDLLGEESAVDNALDIHLIAAGKESQRLFRAFGGAN